MNLSISNSKAQVANFLMAFAVMLAICVGASEWLVRVHVSPMDTLTAHKKRVANISSPYVAFGDSHVARGFDAPAPYVNIAYPSENIEQMAWKAAHFLERVPTPKQVILQADPHLFAEYRLQEGVGDYPERFTRSNERLVSLTDYHKPKLFAYWRSFLLNGGKITTRIEQTPQGALLSPGNLAAYPDDLRKKRVSDRVALHLPRQAFAATVEAQQFQDVVARFVDRGAQVCLVRFPVSPDYNEAEDRLEVREKQRWAAVHAFYRGFSNNRLVTYIDHSRIYRDANLFRDPDHLNKRGAIQYADRLLEDCFGAERATAQPSQFVALSD